MSACRVLLMSFIVLACVTDAHAAKSASFLRSRILEVSPLSLRRANQVGDRLPLRLFSDASYEAVLEHYEDHPLNGLVWRGRLLDSVGSWVILVERQGVMAGVISAGRRLFRVQYVGYGLHAIEEMHPRNLRRLRDRTIERLLPVLPEDLVVAASNPSFSAESDETRIDILMVYTKKAAKRLLNDRYWWVAETDAKKAMESQAALSIAVANTALSNSLVPARFRLVGVKKIAGKGSGNLKKDLQRLWDPHDGHMDKAHRWRDELGADFVVLILGKVEKQATGIAYIVPSSHPYASYFAFSAVWSPTLWWTTVTHEIGHNMGLVHDKRNDHAPPDARSHPYSRGFQNKAKGLATVMAYTRGCPKCWIPIPHYSNPKVQWRGDSRPSDPSLLQPSCRGDEPPHVPDDLSFPTCGTPTGKNRFNAAKSISRDRKIFARFRACQVDCQQSE